jgi:tRNA U34 5-methylaminomethyl-2-thiouridine-forming methyltransferase MnmC
LNKLITTSDGSNTIYVQELDEHYHSVNGAVRESEHIFLKHGFDTTDADPLKIFEVGFGTGLNALLTAVRSCSGERKIHYTSIEKYPLDNEVVSRLNHFLFAGDSGKELSSRIHAAEWDQPVSICENFILLKIKKDLLSYTFNDKYHLIYFDAFGPDKQPDIWSGEIFSKIGAATEKNGVFVTYSAKGEVKRNLRSCGFEVTLLPGPPGKRQIIRAIKI